MSPSLRFQGVIFDMDGVLCDSEPFICEAGCRVLRERYKADAQHRDFRPFTGMGDDRFLAGTAATLGISVKLPEDKDAMYAIYLDLIRDQLQPLNGAKGFVEACRQRGLKVAVASSADRIKVDGNLQQLGLPPAMFDAVLTGSDVTHKKPDPEAFLKAADRMGLPANCCIVIEDAPSGIRAGKSAGARCLGITSSFSEQELLDAGADFTAPDLAHVPGALFDDN